MRERRTVVQFIHPGGEHGPDKNDIKHWNQAPAHKRKFLRARGSYVPTGNVGDKEREAELVFWGEWEPMSTVAELEQPEAEMPRFLHTPHLPRPLLNGSEQNTDPFVFGPQFLYTGCQQHSGKHETQLRWLQRGSVILFGSCRDLSRFVLDTVFVVDRYLDHRRRDYRVVLDGKVPPEYCLATIEPWYAAERPARRSHRLYYGATVEQPVEGTFSFFPCRPLAEGSVGFARPKIEIPGRVNPRLNQGRMQTVDLDRGAVRALWDEVVRQVLSQDLVLGTHADVPAPLDPGMADPGVSS